MISRRDALKLAAAGLMTPSIGRTSPGAAPVMAQVTGRSVPMFRGNAARTGEMPGPAPRLDLPIVVKWKYFTGYSVVSSPAVVGRTVFVGSGRSTSPMAPEKISDIHALDLYTGGKRWALKWSGIYSSPAVADDLMYVGTSDNLLALDSKSGGFRWQFSTDAPVTSSPAVVNGKVFFGSDENVVYALDGSTGDEIWRFALGGEPSRCEISISEGIVIVTHMSSTVHALDAIIGEERWRTKLTRSVRSSAISDGVIFLGSQGTRPDRDALFALDLATGVEIWRSQTSFSWDGPAVNAEYVIATSRASGDSSIAALNNDTGHELWVSGTSGHLPTIADETVFFSAFGPGLHAVALDTGESLWQFVPEQWINSSPVVINGIVLFGCDDGFVYALGNLIPTTLAVDTKLLAAPSESAVERGSARAGSDVTDIGSREERDSVTWVEVTIDSITGWIPLDAIDPATLPPEGEIEYAYIPE